MVSVLETGGNGMGDQQNFVTVIWGHLLVIEGEFLVVVEAVVVVVAVAVAAAFLHLYLLSTLFFLSYCLFIC